MITIFEVVVGVAVVIVDVVVVVVVAEVGVACEVTGVAVKVTVEVTFDREVLVDVDVCSGEAEVVFVDSGAEGREGEDAFDVDGT